MFQHLLIHEPGWRLSVGDRENVIARLEPVVARDLLGPGQTVWRQDHIIERQERILRVKGLFLEHVDSGSGDSNA